MNGRITCCSCQLRPYSREREGPAGGLSGSRSRGGDISNNNPPKKVLAIPHCFTIDCGGKYKQQNLSTHRPRKVFQEQFLWIPTSELV